MELPIKNRDQAGQTLSQVLKPIYGERADLVVLALPRGGVPVAQQVAEALGGELDILLVRKLGTPWQKELAMGAIATGGEQVLNNYIIKSLGISQEQIDRVAEKERQELERRQRLYRGNRPWVELENRCVILVDDGLATGSTMKVAIRALRKQNPAEIIVAVPVAPRDTIEDLRTLVDNIVYLETPEPFSSIGQWYTDFEQVSDDEVIDRLTESWQRQESRNQNPILRHVQIAETEWPGFLAEFSLAHHGWLLTLATIPTRDLIAHLDRFREFWSPVSDQLSLHNIEILESAGGVCEVLISTGEGDSRDLSRINGVINIFRIQLDGGHQGLRIDDNAGSSTLLWFRIPAYPETMNGITESDLAEINDTIH